MVGASGFEPETFCAQGRRATRLRYAPTSASDDSTVAYDSISTSMWLSRAFLRAGSLHSEGTHRGSAGVRRNPGVLAAFQPNGQKPGMDLAAAREKGSQ